MLLRKRSLCALVCFFGILVPVQAQGLAIVPVNGRPGTVSHASNYNVALHGLPLELPFFDDFTTTNGYPSEHRWADRQVWVNNTFPVNPPNYNVATFDHLDARGVPYNLILNKNIMVFADSLTSVPIKLDFYKTGPTTTENYQVTDSIYLSFFFQRMGIGDMPESEDSLILFFLTKTGKWNRVWAKIGGVKNDFEIAVIPVNSFDYLHGSFQFRFVNYTKSTGNLNHWHIDYVRLEKYKGRGDGFDLYDIRDVGIVKPLYSRFNTYFSLPKDHFLTDVSGLTRTSDALTIRNLNPAVTVPTRFARNVYNQYDAVNEVDSFPLTTEQNVQNNSLYTFIYPNIKIDSFSGENPCYIVTHFIAPSSIDNTPDQYNSEGNNNRITVKHCFTPWYAYDDGSAEGGFGLDYAFLGNIKGQFAMKFDNLKEDSLRGLAIYFNRSESDVRFRSFYLRVWRSLSPLGSPDNKDEMVYEQFVQQPIYTDSINHFSYIFFDTILPLPKGNYYVGWRQNQPFVLNVGYDNNYRYQDQETGNPNLFHNLLGSWERADNAVRGVPMIRPLLGTEAEYKFSVRERKTAAFSLYPNPAENSISWNAPEPISTLQIFDLGGRRVLAESGSQLQTCDISALAPGTYFMVLTTASSKNIRNKFIKN